MKAIKFLVMVALVNAMGIMLIGCSTGDTTVEPAQIEVTTPEVVVNTAPVIVTVIMPENNETIEPVPEGADGLFKGLNVIYNTSGFNSCGDGKIVVTGSFATNKEIDIFAFVNEYYVDGELYSFSSVNVAEGDILTAITDTIYTSENLSSEVKRHRLDFVYYLNGDKVRLSKRYLDQAPCER